MLHKQIIYSFIFASFSMLYGAKNRTNNPYGANVLPHGANVVADEKNNMLSILEIHRLLRNCSNTSGNSDFIKQGSFQEWNNNLNMQIVGLPNLKIQPLQAPTPSSDLTKSNSPAEILFFLLQNMQNRHPSTSPCNFPREDIEKKLIRLINACTPEELRKVNLITGQAVINQFTPLHWSKKIMDCLAQKANLVVQTGPTDRYPGSTIAHNVAHLLHNEHKRYDKTNESEIRKHVLHIENMKFFLSWWITKYPESLTLKSQNNDGRKYNFYEVLNSVDQSDIYKRLSPETVRAIHEDLNKKRSFGEITEQEYHNFYTSFPSEVPTYRR
jgi:hypothetical protein